MPSFLILSHSDYEANVGKRCEMFLAPPCTCPFCRLLDCLVCLFVFFDTYVPWYPVHLHLCSALGQLLSSLDDAFGQPLSWARVHVLYPFHSCLPISPDMNSRPVFPRLVSAGLSLCSSILQCNPQDLPHCIQLCIEQLFVGAQVRPLRFLLRFMSCDAGPYVPRVHFQAVRSEGYLVESIHISSGLFCPILFSFCEGGYASGERLRFCLLDVLRTFGGVNADALCYCLCEPMSHGFSPTADRFEPVVISFQQFPWLSQLLSLLEC